MPPALYETSQLAPSQFNHLKSIQPTTTASGVTPGQALLDTPSPDHPPTVLERSQRVRQPSKKKIEASQSQVTTSKSKGKEPANPKANKSNGKNLRNRSDASSSTANPASQAGARDATTTTGTNEIQEGYYISEDDEVVDQAIIDLLEEFVGGSVAHLSHRQLRDLLDAMPPTQALTMETQAEPPSAITKSPARVGLASRDRNGSPAGEVPGNRLSSQKQNTSPNTSKCVCISANKDDTATEDEEESDGNSDVPRCRRRTKPSDFNSDCDPGSDSDSDSEAESVMA